jgi:cystathionine beta-lyase family protein involved in aluminum resistance
MPSSLKSNRGAKEEKQTAGKDSNLLIRQAEERLRGRFAEVDEIVLYNQKKVLTAFQGRRIRESHFNLSSGYAYGDQGREGLDLVFADIFRAEAAMVRTQIVSGTHAVSAPMAALLERGDQLVSLLGTPYDTLKKVIGSATISHSLVAKGIRYQEVPLSPRLTFDPNAAAALVTADTRMVFLQRSRGYHWRGACTTPALRAIISWVRSRAPQAIVLVDNCYGEFSQTLEPLEVGADLIAGSLIKNPGGGLAPAGGYIAGRGDLVEKISYHLTAPFLGRELGASLTTPRWLYQGLFMAPHVVGQALKGAMLSAYCLEQRGYEVSPSWNEERGDIVQAVRLKNMKQLLRFCQTVQSNSPIDSDTILEYGALPAYDDPVVMAAGTFVQGGSLELSCDAPCREPYTAFMQGGLTYEHVKLVLDQLLYNL